MSAYPTKSIFTENINASQVLYVGGSINQNVIAVTGTVPINPNPLDKIYNTNTSLFNTYYNGGWIESEPMPGQIINVLTGPEAGLVLIQPDGTPSSISQATSYTVGGTAYVSSSTGDDDLAELNNPSKQYATISAAYNDAVLEASKYVIYVYPGTYQVTQNICSPNVDYVFSSGTTVNCVGVIPFSNDVGLDVSGFSCLGHAEFISDVPLIEFIEDGGRSITSNVSFQCDSIMIVGTADAVHLHKVTNISIDVSKDISVTDGHIIYLEHIGSNFESLGHLKFNNASASSGIWIQGTSGLWTIEGNTLVGDTALEVNINIECYMRVGQIISLDAVTPCITNSGAGTHITCDSLDAAGPIFNNISNLYINAGRATSGFVSTNTGTAYIDFTSLQGSSVMTSSSGEITLNVDSAILTDYLLNVVGGRGNVTCGKLISDAAALRVGAGTLVVKGSVQGTTPIQCESVSSVLTVQGVLHSTGVNSITASSPINILSYSSYANLVADANVTVVGNLYVDPAVII